MMQKDGIEAIILELLLQRETKYRLIVENYEPLGPLNIMGRLLSVEAIDLLAEKVLFIPSIIMKIS